MTMIKLTNQEKQMYGVMGAISNSGIPVVYKGALITKLILQEGQFDDFTRETQDIDASWAGSSPPPMERLTAMLNNALKGLGLNAIAVRAHGEKMSACYDIVEVKSGELAMTIDIDMRAAVDSRTYQYGSVTFRGVTPDNVIGDKISAVSTDKVFRRAKDLLDLYALAHCVSIKTSDIFGLWAREGRSIGSFDAFMNRQAELRQAYDKLRRVDLKPGFSEVYGYLGKLLPPFVSHKPNLVWNGKTASWKPRSLLGELEAAKETVAQTPPNPGKGRGEPQK